MAYLELDVLNNVAKPIIGIDLGTTNSLVAIWRDGRPVVLRPDPRDSRIPSVIHFPEKGTPVLTDVRKELNAVRYVDRALTTLGELRLEQSSSTVS